LVKPFNSKVTLTKLHVSDCGGAKDTTQYNETKKELVSYCQWFSDLGGNDIAKSIINLDLVNVVVEDVCTADVNDINALEVKVWFSKYSTVVE
jgi:hypothetical protein